MLKKALAVAAIVAVRGAPAFAFDGVAASSSPAIVAMTVPTFTPS